MPNQYPRDTKLIIEWYFDIHSCGVPQLYPLNRPPHFELTPHFPYKQTHTLGFWQYSAVLHNNNIIVSIRTIFSAYSDQSIVSTDALSAYRSVDK